MAAAGCKSEGELTLSIGMRPSNGSTGVRARTGESLDGVLGERAAGLGQRIRPFRRIDIAIRIDRDPFTCRALIHTIVALEGRDESGDAIFVEETDTHAVTPVRVVQWTRLGVDDIQGRALDEEAARPAEGVTRLQVLAVLIEDLEPVVAAIRDPQTSPGVEHQRVRRAELAVLHADRAPRFQEFAVGRELADARGGAALEPFGDRRCGDHALGVVAVGDIDAAVGPGDDVVRLVELTIATTWLAGGAKAEKLLALRTELVDLLSLGALLVVREVGNPHVAILVDVDAVRRHHHAFADVRQHCAGVTVELENRIERGVVAIDRAAAGRTGAAALVGPDVSVLRIDVDTG